MTETTMLRTFWLAALAAASLASVAMTPTAAAACAGGHHHRWCGPPIYLGAPVSYGYGGCYVRELLATPWGPRWRLVDRCY